MTTWREDLAWAAGFFDGEGHTRASEREGRKAGSLSMIVPQNDKRVLERFQAALLGMGTITGPHARPEKKNEFYVWVLTSAHKCQAAIAMLWEFLDTIKREQAAQALAVCAWGPPTGYCRNGHRIADDMWADGRCGKCARTGQARRHRAKQAALGKTLRFSHYPELDANGGF